MTPDEQREYVRKHPHTHMIPHSTNKSEDLVNPDRARATALAKKIQDTRKNLAEAPKSSGLPSGADDLIRHLKRSDDPKSHNLLKTLQSSWDDVSKEFKGKVSNPELFKMWSTRLNRDHARDIGEIKNSLKNDHSPSAAHATQSIDNILGAANAGNAHIAQIALEFLRVSSQE